MSTSVERGDIYWVELDPTRGAEIAKTRPCIILSATEINLHRKTVIALPLTTTSAAAAPPLLVAVPSAGATSKARIEHIRAVDKTRLQRRIGRVSSLDLQSVEAALRQVLRLPKD